ncbi:hypothetical protein B5S31_g2952 [[Candida] boidinii]|nr:hypothetical protein B5S29_g2238 [[Candida] boidinii]OWB73218.1 hypothetical protein B5S31_g2952 [[Candida] boidinii]OWB77128.1 hypothetical protein B5S32_g1288 [[Candida] boidinii]
MSNFDETSTPAICENCLGKNPYLEMIREVNGAECKTCTRVFPVFKWAPVKGGRFKRTVICLTCARARNCCQSCMLDLTYGIDLRTRDQLLKLAGSKTMDLLSAPVNETSKKYVANNLERKYLELGESGIESQEEKRQKATEILQKLSETKSNNIKVKDNEKENTNKKNSNNNNNEANSKSNDNFKLSSAEILKLTKGLPLNGTLKNKPKNEETKSFFIFGFNEKFPEYLIKEFFSDKFNIEIEAITLNHKGGFGYIYFKSRKISELVSELILKSNGETNPVNYYTAPFLLIIDRTPVRVCWGAPPKNSLNHTNAQLYKINSIVKRQMKKFADQDNKATASEKRKVIESNSTNTNSNKKKKSNSVPLPPSKKINYKSLQNDYEI